MAKPPKKLYSTALTDTIIEETSVTLIPTTLNRSLAVLLEGTPKQFPPECTQDLQMLYHKGIAADFGDEGWARGHKWRSYIRK